MNPNYLTREKRVIYARILGKAIAEDAFEAFQARKLMKITLDRLPSLAGRRAIGQVRITFVVYNDKNFYKKLERASYKAAYDRVKFLIRCSEKQRKNIQN